MWIGGFQLEGESFRDVGAFFCKHDLPTRFLTRTQKRGQDILLFKKKKKNNASVLRNLCNQEAAFFFSSSVPARALGAPERMAIAVIMEKWKR